jgi:hypothetical protein
MTRDALKQFVKFLCDDGKEVGMQLALKLLHFLYTATVRELSSFAHGQILFRL